MFLITKNTNKASTPFAVANDFSEIEWLCYALNFEEEIYSAEDEGLVDHPSAFVNSNGNKVLKEYIIESQDGDFIGSWEVSEIQQMADHGMVWVL